MFKILKPTLEPRQGSTPRPPIWGGSSRITSFCPLMDGSALCQEPAAVSWALAIGCGDRAEPMGRRRGANGESPRSARERDHYKLCPGESLSCSCPGRRPPWEGQRAALISSCPNMVRTRADSLPGTYRKVVAARAPRKVLGSSTSATNFTSPSSRKAENKYAGGNPVCVRPTPKWQKGIGEFFRLSPKDSEKENRIPEEAGSSGLGKGKRKVHPLPPDDTDDEKE